MGGYIYPLSNKAGQLFFLPMSVCVCVTVAKIPQEQVFKLLSNSHDIIIRSVAQTDKILEKLQSNAFTSPAKHKNVYIFPTN